MHQLFNKKNIWLYLLVFTSFIMLLGEVINERFYMHDLEVYYKTAYRLVNGQELYRIKADGHYIFKYSPTSAVYFVPLLLLPYGGASTLYWFFLTFLVCAFLNTFYNLTAHTPINQNPIRHKNIVLLLTFLTVVTHFHRELHLGQVNLLLVGLFVFTLQNLFLKNYKIAGLLLAVSLFLKPFGLIFLPYLVVKTEFRALLYTSLFVVILGLFPLFFYPGLVAFKQLYVSWFQELAIEMAAKQSLLKEGNHTIFSVMGRYTPLRYMLGNAAVSKIYQLIVLGLIGGAFLFFIQKGRYLKQALVAEGAVLICFIPLFAFTSMNAFIFAVPCIIYLLYHGPYLALTAKIFLTVGCILIGGNNYDLVGRRMFNLLEANSVYTLGALILLGLMFYLRFKKANTAALLTTNPVLQTGTTCRNS